MGTDGMIFRSVYVDQDVDRAVRAHSKTLGVTAGSVYRMFLEAGLAQLDEGALLPDESLDPVVAFRSAYVRFESDEQLRVSAFRRRMAKGDFSRRVTRLGMMAIVAALGPTELRSNAEKTL